jgi:hypothetical protein
MKANGQLYCRVLVINVREVIRVVENLTRVYFRLSLGVDPDLRGFLQSTGVAKSILQGAASGKFLFRLSRLQCRRLDPKDTETGLGLFPHE